MKVCLGSSICVSSQVDFRQLCVFIAALNTCCCVVLCCVGGVHSKYRPPPATSSVKGAGAGAGGSAADTSSERQLLGTAGPNGTAVSRTRGRTSSSDTLHHPVLHFVPSRLQPTESKDDGSLPAHVAGARRMSKMNRSPLAQPRRRSPRTSGASLACVWVCVCMYRLRVSRVTAAVAHACWGVSPWGRAREPWQRRQGVDLRARPCQRAGLLFQHQLRADVLGAPRGGATPAGAATAVVASNRLQRQHVLLQPPHSKKCVDAAGRRHGGQKAGGAAAARVTTPASACVPFFVPLLLNVCPVRVAGRELIEQATEHDNIDQNKNHALRCAARNAASTGVINCWTSGANVCVAATAATDVHVVSAMAHTWMVGRSLADDRIIHSVTTTSAAAVPNTASWCWREPRCHTACTAAAHTPPTKYPNAAMKPKIGAPDTGSCRLSSCAIMRSTKNCLYLRAARGVGEGVTTSRRAARTMSAPPKKHKKRPKKSHALGRHGNQRFGVLVRYAHGRVQFHHFTAFAVGEVFEFPVTGATVVSGVHRQREVLRH